MRAKRIVFSFLSCIALLLSSVPSLAVFADDGVAKIGETEYETLAEAVTAASEGDTIVLISDVTEDVVIPTGTDITLDLNGYTLANVSDHTITNNGTLTITDSSEGKTGTVDNVTHAKAALMNNQTGKVTLNGGTFTRSKEAGTDPNTNGGNSYYVIQNWGEMEINSPTSVYSDGAFSSLVENGYYDSSKDNTTGNNPTLTINGGTFEGGIYFVKNDDCGILVINDGTFKLTNENSQYGVLNYGIAEINGGSFSTIRSVICNYSYGTAVDPGILTINGGEFTSEISNAVYIYKATDYQDSEGNSGVKITGGTFVTNSSDGYAVTTKNGTSDNVSVEGGTFSTDVSEYMTDGVLLDSDGNGGYTVVSDTYAAKIGTKYYNDVQTAINDIAGGTATGNTVTLIRDVTENIKISDGINVVLDLNKFTLTHDVNTTSPTSFCVDNAGTLEIKNGNIESTHASTSCVRNNGTLTLDGVTVTSAFVSVKNEPEANLTIKNCDISTTYTKTNTGCIMNWGNATVSNSTISSEKCAAIYAVSGDGIDSSITLNNCTLSGYYAVYTTRDLMTDTTTQTVIINGGTLSATYRNGIQPYTGSVIEINGEVNTDAKTTKNALKYAQKGAVITLTADLNSSITVPEGVTLIIPDDVSLDISGGYTLELDGTILSEKDGEPLSVEEVGEKIGAVVYNENNKTYYASVSKAISSWSSDNVTANLILVDDTVEDITLAATKVINLDLNGKNITGDITLDGGTLVIDDSTETPGFVNGTLTVGEEASLTTKGGTYSVDVSDYVPEGMSSVSNGDGTWTVQTDYACTIDGNKYATINAAISAIEANDTKTGTITLARDVTEDVVIPENTTITLDLDGKTLTNVKDHTITNNGTLTITDSSESQTGTVDNVTHQKAALMNNPSGTVTLNGGTFTRSKETGIDSDTSGGNSYYVIKNWGKMEINSPTSVYADGAFSSLIENGYQNASKENTANNNPTLTINGGTFEGGINVVKNDDCGILTIEGGRFTNTAGPVVFNTNVATINDGTFISTAEDKAVLVNGYLSDDVNAGLLTINGGTFTAGNDGKGLILDKPTWATNGGTLTITDGTFTGTWSNASDLPYEVAISGGIYSEDVSAYVTDDKLSDPNNGDGTYTVVSNTYAAKIGTTSTDTKYYTTIQEAINAIANGTETDGSTITLVRDVTENIYIKNTVNAVLDLNKFTLTHDNTTSPTPYCVDNEGTLEIINGNIVSTHESTSCIRNNVGGKLTLEDVTVTSAFVSVKNENDADLTINNCDISTTYTEANTGCIMNWGNATVSNSTISGGSNSVAIYATSGADGGKDSSITLNNCTLSGKYAVYAKRDSTSDTTTQTVIINGGSLSATATTGLNIMTGSVVEISGEVKADANTTKNALTYAKQGAVITLTGDLSGQSITVPEDVTLIIPDDASLTISKSYTLELNGTLLSAKDGDSLSVEEVGELIGAVAYNENNKTYYASLSKAISLWDSTKGTADLILVNDTTEDITNKVAAKEINLDLNGKNITGDITLDGGTLVIDDSTATPGLVKGTLTIGEEASLTTVGGRYSDANVINYVPKDSKAVIDEDGNYSIHKHEYGEITPAKAATCTEAGNKAYAQCSTCNDWFIVTYDDEDVNLENPTYTACKENDWVISATGHKLEKTEAKAATCTEAGNIEYWTCSVCDKVFNDENGVNEITLADTVIPATGHNYGEITPAKAATCTEAGNKAYAQCSTCNDWFIVTYDDEDVNHENPIYTACEENDWVISATGHTEVTDEAVAPTCTSTGLTEGSHCSVCGDVLTDQRILPATRHIVVTDEAVAATCTSTGLTEGSHCLVCGEVIKAQEEVPATGHTVVTDAAVAATCTSTGLTEGSHCSVCGEVIKAQEVTAKLDHKLVTDKAVEATCTTSGKTMGLHCSVCNTVILAQETVAATGHTAVTDEAVAATCTESGKTAGSHCSVCGTVLTAQEEVPATGHKLEKTEAKEATCTEAGNIEYWTCSECGKVFSDEKGENEITLADTVIAAGHTLEKTAAKDATCTEDGNIEYWTCSVCGKVYSDKNGENEITLADTVIKAAGHKYYVSGICVVCGEKDPNYKEPTTNATTTVTTAQACTCKDDSDAVSVVKQAKLTKLKVKSNSKKTITVKWGKVTKAKGYQVQVSKVKDFNKIIVDKQTTKLKLKIKNSKIKSKKTYYVRVRAYTTYNTSDGTKQKVYSKWNRVLRKVKVK